MSSDTINLHELLDAVEALREEVGGLREEVSGFRERIANLEDAAASLYGVGFISRRHLDGVRKTIERVGSDASVPDSTMFGFSNMPSNATPCSASAAKVLSSASLVASSQRSMLCGPSIRTSGSTIGTNPASCSR